MKFRSAVALIVIAMSVSMAGVARLHAHHSMVMYDQQKNVTIGGIVKRIEFKNPHSMFTITVTDTQGSEVDWTLESQPLATLTSYGWAESTMKLGDKVTAIGYPARNGKPAMLVQAIQLPDGRTIKT